MTKRLIVNADDFGISDGISRGILEAHTKGIVTSTSVMVNMSDVGAAIKMCNSDAPLLGMGLHITLTWGKPILPASEVPSLVNDEGLFKDIFHIQPSTINTKQLRAEINAQYKRFCELADKAPDHIDAHQFAANLSPAGFEMIIELALKNRIPIRTPTPFLYAEIMKDLANSMGGGRIDGQMLATMEMCIEPNRQLLVQHGRPKWTDFFEYHFFDRGSNRENLLRILKNLPEGTTELMCHPGYGMDLENNEGYRELREKELDILTDPEIRQLVKSERIRLIKFSDI